MLLAPPPPLLQNASLGQKTADFCELQVSSRELVQQSSWKGDNYVT